MGDFMNSLFFIRSLGENMLNPYLMYSGAEQSKTHTMGSV